jgi:hypothetical protein
MRMPTLMNRVMQAVSSRFGIGGNIQGYLPWTLTGWLSPRKHTGKTIFTISIGYRKLVMTLRSYVKYLLRLARVQHPKNRSSWEALPLGKKTDIGFEDLLCQASKWIVLW